jgi:hypothetical protein
MADVHAKPVRWSWQNYLPEGAIAVLDSDPGEGKSTMLTDISARHSVGNAMPPHTAPDGTYERGKSLLLIGEDDIERTVKPRLAAAGATTEPGWIKCLRTVSIDGEDERLIQLPGDIPLIERIVVQNQIKFIGIDVLSCFVGPGLSTNIDEDMRKITTPFANMLERTRATSLWLRHFNKKEGSRAMYRGSGSVAINAAARAVFAIGPHPDDRDIKVLAPIKHNLGPRPPSLEYSLEVKGDVSVIAWRGETSLTAAEVLKNHEKGSGGAKTEAAKEIIIDMLSKGPRGSNEVEEACKAANISRGTYWNARRALRVKSDKTDFNGNWLLALPSTNGHHNEEYNGNVWHEEYNEEYSEEYNR